MLWKNVPFSLSAAIPNEGWINRRDEFCGPAAVAVLLYWILLDVYTAKGKHVAAVRHIAKPDA